MNRNLLIGLIGVVIPAGCYSLGGLHPLPASREVAIQADTQGDVDDNPTVLFDSVVNGVETPGLDIRRTVYFDFNSRRIRSEELPVIRLHAQYLVSHPEFWVILEGHTDQRGSQEYNLILGEARAKAVAKVLVENGVSHDRIHIGSFGEGKPVVVDNAGSSDEQNRRVEFIYRRQRVGSSLSVK